MHSRPFKKIYRLIKKTKFILKKPTSDHVNPDKNQDNLSELNNTTANIVNKLVLINENLDSLVKDKTTELEEVNEKLKEKEEELIKQSEILSLKEEELDRQNKKLQMKEEELTEYINKIFEQQERERIVKWIVNSIRESLELDKVLSTAVEEIGRLLKIDRCLIALFDYETLKFTLQNEYRLSEDISSVLDTQSTINISQEWHNNLVIENKVIVVNDVEACLNSQQNPQFIDAKSLVISPIIHKGEMLGAIFAHQIQYRREWGVSHIEILKDISSQIAIAIRQASLYTQAQESTRLKSEFLANMSHEFRTPLNAIIGFSDMLSSGNYGNLTDKQKDYLNNITISGRHLLRLVNDVLDLSKVESGNMELHYEKFDSGEIIQESVFTLKNMATKKNIIIELNVCKALLNADIGKMRQIMYNLLSNAIKFTEENGKIVVNTYLENNNLKVEVNDTGIGISPRDRNKIFSRFRQLDSSYSKKQEGTGLGLTLTKKLIELHKGSIDFESEEGKGTKFWFTIPGAEKLVRNKVK